MATSIERKWGAASHWLPVVVGFLTGGLFGWLVTLIIYLTQRQRSQFIGFHAYQSLFFQGVMSVVALIGWLLRGVGIGYPILMVATIVGILVPIIGAVHAGRGEWWRNPILGGRRKSLYP